MATIQLSDNATLDETISPDPISLFGKYVLDQGSMAVPMQVATDLSKKTDGNAAQVQDLNNALVNITFKQSVPLGNNEKELEIGAGTQGSMSLTKASTLFDKELYDDAPGLPAASLDYLSASVKASVDSGFTNKLGDVKLGFDGGADVTLTSSRPVNHTDPLLPSVEKALENFLVPLDLEHITSMPPLSVAAVQGNGSLKFSIEFDAPIAPNPLASLPTGVLGSVINVSAAPKLGVSVAPSITGGYKVQVTKVDGQNFLLGYSKTKGSKLEVTVTGSVGVSAGIGDTDLVAPFLKAVLPDAKLSEKDLKNLNISDDEISAMASAIKGGIQKSLQVSLQEQLDAAADDGTVFLYRINLATLDQEGRQAVSEAIDGDLSRIEGQGTLAGVTVIRSIVTDTQERSRAFKVNLFGILNFGSVQDYIQKTEWKTDDETQDVTLIDTNQASDVGYRIDNLAKAKALRSIVADGVLATSVYMASKTGYGPPGVTANCWAFDLEEKPGPGQMKSYLDVAVALNLLDASAAQQTLAQSHPPFGETTFNVEVKIGDPLFDSLFFVQADTPRSFSDYQKVGRDASLRTPPPDLPPEILQARQDALGSDDLWKEMTGKGDFQDVEAILKLRLGDVWAFDTIAKLIYSDYVIVTWWASAMSNVAKPLSAVRDYLKSQPVADPNNNTLNKLRGDLNKQLSKAIRQVHDQFAEPWGVVAMDLASGQKAEASFLIESSGLRLRLQRAVPAKVASAASR